MKTILDTLHKAGTHGKFKQTGNKLDPLNEYRRILCEPALSALPLNKNGASGDKSGASAAAKGTRRKGKGKESDNEE
jgi:hypothetical protein